MRIWRISVCGLACVLCLLSVALAVGIKGKRAKFAKCEESRPGVRALIPHWSREGREVRVRFDRPVVGPDEIGSPAPLRANVPGTAIWTGVASARFIAEREWPRSFDVKVSMPVVTAFDGTRTEGEPGLTWRTAGLEPEAQVADVYGPLPAIRVDFGAVVDPREVEARSFFCGPRGPVCVRWTDRGLEPERPLAGDGRWTLCIHRGLRAIGGARLEADWQVSFEVAGPPRLDRSWGLSSLADDNEIVLEFSQRLVPATVGKRLTVTPAATFRWSVQGERLHLVGALRPGESYWVRLAEGVEDRFGGRLSAVTAVVTIPPYTPALSLEERASVVERYGSSAVPLVTASVPVARVRLFRLPAEPWNAAAGELVEERVFPANDGPNDIFTHAVRFPGPGSWRVEAGATEMPLRDQSRYQVTDLAPTVKIGRSGSLIAVTTLAGARPVAGAAVALHDAFGRLLWRGESGADGCVTAPGADRLGATRYVVARKDDDLSWADLFAREIGSWRLGVDVESPEAAEPLRLFLHADRPVYKPGETVRVKGWWRGATAKTVKVELRGWDDEVIGTATCRVSAAGGLDTAFALPEKASPGSYRLRAEAAGGVAWATVEVGAYRAPSMEVTMTAREKRVFAGGRIEVDLRARTFFGAPLSGAGVEWRATMDEGGVVAQGEGKLDPDGKMSLSVPAGKKAGVLAIDADVHGAGNDSVGASTDVAVLEADVVLHLQRDRGLVCAWQPTGVTISATTSDGAPFAGTVHARLVRRTWSSVQRAMAGGGWSFTQQEVKEVEAEEDVRPGLWTVTPRHSGDYMVEVSARDSAGRETKAQATFDVEGRGAAWEPNERLLLTLTPDRERYRPGDTARVLIRGALPGSRALVTLEREGVRDPRWVEMPDGTAVVEVAIEAAMAPNVHVFALALCGRTTRSIGSSGEDRGRPAMRPGAVSLAVDAGDLQMPVTVRVPAKARPGEEVTVEVETAPGAEIALAVVDDAVLSLTGEADPDPLAFFSAARPLRVRTSEMRPDVAALRPLDVRGKKGRAGGGGGDDGPSVRRDFRGTAFWAPALVAGPDGRARATFRLPDNTTRWRAVAVASTGARWGTGAAAFAADRPLTLVAALPRVVRSGDRFLARVVVHNRSGADGVAKVSLGTESKDALVAAGEPRAFDFPVEAGEPGERRFTFRATLNGHEDAVEIAVPVRYPSAEESWSLSGSLDLRERLDGPGFVSVEDATLAVGATPLAEIDGELRRLLDYPHG